MVGRMMEIRCHDLLLRNDSNLQMIYAKDMINWFVDYLNLSQVIAERIGRTPWTWYGSMFYAGTLYTTIGYGRPAAYTWEGQLSSILYIMIGIPLFLVILKEVGKHLSRLLRKVYKNWKRTRQRMPTPKMPPLHRYPMAVHRQLMSSVGFNKSGTHSKTENISVELESSQNANGARIFIEENEKNDRKMKSINFNSSPVLGNQFEDKDDKRKMNGNRFPISLALGILILWICMSAALFCIWETQWGYFTSVYFFFVSISTVGLGDIIPSKPDMMLANFLLILVGLALLSMCINLIQIWIEHLLDDMLQQFMEEFGKIAAEVVNERSQIDEQNDFDANAIMADDHLTMAKSARNWLAGRLVRTRLGASRLGFESSSSADSSSEDEREIRSNSLTNRPFIVGSNMNGRKLSRLISESNSSKMAKQSKKLKLDTPAMRAMEILTKSGQADGLKNRFLINMFSKDKLHMMRNCIKTEIMKHNQMSQTEDLIEKSPPSSYRNNCSKSPSPLSNSTTSYYTCFEPKSGKIQPGHRSKSSVHLNNYVNFAANSTKTQDRKCHFPRRKERKLSFDSNAYTDKISRFCDYSQSSIGISNNCFDMDLEIEQLSTLSKQ